MSETIKRLSELKDMNWKALNALPAHSQRELKENGRRIIESVWVDKRSENEIQVVVQRYRPGVLIGSMTAAGFRKLKTGDIVSIPDEDLFEFL